MTEIKNGRIGDTHLGFEDHGIFTYNISIDYGGSVQGFGGYSLKYYGIDAITGILRALKKNSWEDLIGTPVRIERDSEFNGKIFRIGHYLEDNWYSPKEHEEKISLDKSKKESITNT